MNLEPVSFTLKDGRSAILRSPGAEDCDGMLDYLYTSTAETEFLLRYPEECGTFTPEKERALLEAKKEADNEIMIACVIDGKIAGNCQIGWSTNLKMKHRANVAIALLKDYWNLGIGTRMFEEMIRIAKENPDILQIELEFIEGNSRARALYEKVGFRVTGVRPDAIRLKDGRLLNEYTMMLKIR